MRTEKELDAYNGMTPGLPVHIVSPPIAKVLSRIVKIEWPEAPQYGYPETSVCFHFTDGTFTNSVDAVRPADPFHYLPQPRPEYDA